MKKITVKSIRQFKKQAEKITALTAYDYFTAKYLDQAGIDIILVGDSANMVIYGRNNTLSMPMEVMLYHTQAVKRAVKRALVVGDMPFGSYQKSEEEAMQNGIDFLKVGAEAIKLEGGEEIIPIVKRMVNAGIPVMGHLGSLPQSVNIQGGYPVAGETQEERKYLLRSAKKLEEVGVFAIVLEKVKADVAKSITEMLNIPTIGIGSGAWCDGQILVVNDILGLFDRFKPPFARKYIDLKQSIKEAVNNYIRDVKSGDYPSQRESFL